MTSRGPIALFAYRRAGGFRRALQALKAAPEFAASPVFVFSDAPAEPRFAADVARVRAMIAALRTPNMTVVEAETNKGLARSIIDGVTQLTQAFGRVIVVEDDLVLSPAALTWLNAELDAYAGDERVMQVSAYTPRAPQFRARDRGLFLPFTTTWGWATWKRAWDQFDPNAEGWQELAGDASLRAAFDLGGAFPYAAMLESQMAGGHDSWGIRWYWSVFRRGGLVLYPPRSLVRNRGMDTKATHGIRTLLLAQFRRGAGRIDMAAPALPGEVRIDGDDVRAAASALRQRRL